MAREVDISRPVPDPTRLTTEQLLRELTSLREIIEARLDGSDRRMNTLELHLDERQIAIKDEVAHLRTLHEERFHSIATQFTERDIRTEQTARNSEVAVDAALQAQKEAAGAQNESNAASITKSEAAFTKQIDAMNVNINNSAKSLDDKITDIKDRLTSIESTTAGRISGIGGMASTVLGVFVILAAIASITAVIITITHH